VTRRSKATRIKLKPRLLPRLKKRLKKLKKRLRSKRSRIRLSKKT